MLAYLIQGDGNFDKGRNRVRIYTNSYQKSEVENLALAIKTKLNIYAAPLLDRKDQWILTIGAKNLELLRNIVLASFLAKQQPTSPRSEKLGIAQLRDACEAGYSQARSVGNNRAPA